MIATITIESKKRYKRMVIAVCLAISMFVGSAFALSPSYQNVSMPDPYGIMPLSLSSESGAYTITSSGTVRIGHSSSAYSSISNYSGTVSSTSGISQIIGRYSTTGKGVYLYVPSGTYFDIVSPISYPVSEYSGVVVAGGGGFRLWSYGTLDGVRSYVRAYADTVQVLVNGSPVGDVISCDDGDFVLNDLLVDITSDVTTVGLRFSYTSAYTGTVSTSDTSNFSPVYCFMGLTDNVVVTPVVDDSLDYEPFFNRVIAWEQSIYGAIQSLGDSLSESFGGVGESASRIASVFARDDDIQLRDDVDEAVTEVTDSFFTPAAEGETETEFDSATKIDKQKVTDVKQVAEGASALFDTGYEFTDGFEIIATDDSFLSWFTAETATALDSTGAVATVGDDDPYNMHFYYDHLQEIEVWKGD